MTRVDFIVRFATRLAVVALVVGVLLDVPTARADALAGQMTWAVHTTLVPAWLDPADNIQQTPFMVQWRFTTRS